MLEKILSSPKAATSLIPTMRSSATSIFASGLTPACVSGEGSPTSHPKDTAAGMTN